MQTDYKPVLETYVRNVDKLVHLTVNGEEIVTTFDHPFYVNGKGFINAVDLCIGTELVDSTGTILYIEQIYREMLGDESVRVYNFKVDEYHTFFVGDNVILVHNAAYSKDADLIQELKDNNIKFNEDEILRMTRNAEGKIVWLEEGNSTSGYLHILEEHAGDFANQGISASEIPDYIMDALTNGEVVGSQGRSPGRPIYSFEYNGEIREVAITVGSNGYIVGANPR